MITGITTSAEPVTISYSSFQLTFSNVELHQDQHACIIRCNLQNTGKYEESISSNSFILAANMQEVRPNVSYISDLKSQGTLWAWKRIKPEDLCTIIMKFQLDSHYSNYEFKYNYRNIHQLIKRFQRSTAH